MREKLLMNRDWLFYYGEPAYKDRKNTSQDQVYRGSRGQNARGPARRDFLDYDWRIVQLPHDFVYEHGQTRENPDSKHGNFPADRGSAWYRKYFKLDEADKGKRISLIFDGVSTRCEVYVNSILLETNRTAGIGFEVDITEMALFGSEYNEVSVHADCHDYEAWYYEGGGIYRDVWLVKTDNLCVNLWGTYVSPERIGDKLWNVKVETEILNNYYDEKNARVISRIIDTEGKEIACKSSDEVLFPAQQVTTLKESFELTDPVLWWDRQENKLYSLKTEVYIGTELVDTYSTDFGIREISFDAEKGMLLNGRPTTVYGFSNHMTYFGVGDAMSDSMYEFFVRSIADMGGNGFRTVHSPFDEALYEYCDKYGLLVMDENRIFHPSKIVIGEVQRMVKRDRNHPSILFYSMYNEEDLMATPMGKRIYKKLATAAKQLDPARPVSGATSYGMFTVGAHEDHDLFGVNHQTNNFDSLHRAKPDKPLYCSEMVAPLSRDLLFHPSRHAEDARQLEKDFAWGGFQFTAWGTGTYDQQGGKSNVTQGFKAYLLRDKPLADIMPGWNFPGKEGKEVLVYLPNNGEYVEVYVNDKFIAKVETDYYEITPLKLTYEPGTIKVISYKDGKVWAEGEKTTPGKAVGIKLVMENPSLKADDKDIAIITAYIVDENGRHVDSEYGYPAKIYSNEAGEYINAISMRRDRFQGINKDRVSFENGKLQAFFRSMDTEGDLVVSIDAEGLGKSELVIKREHTGKGAVVETVPNTYVMDWQISTVFPSFMDENEIMKRHEVNDWEHIDTQGSPDVLYQCLPPLFGFGPALYPAGTIFNYAYYTKVRIPDLGKKEEGKDLGLYFEGIDGKANIVVTNGKKTARAHHPSDSPWPGHYKPELKMLLSEFEAGEEVEIWVFIYDAKRVTGVAWPVRFIYTSEDEVLALAEKTAYEWDLCNYNKD